MNLAQFGRDLIGKREESSGQKWVVVVIVRFVGCKSQTLSRARVG
jgi:hypothetical protein